MDADGVNRVDGSVEGGGGYPEVEDRSYVEVGDDGFWGDGTWSEESEGEPAGETGRHRRQRDDGFGTGPSSRLPFGRRQLLVLVALLGAGLLLAGWAVLRARPVALATPTSASSSASSSASTSGSTGQPVGAGRSRAAGASPPAGSATPSIPPGAPPTHAARPVIEVHVLGAVKRAGLVSLPAGARVADALAAAGGLRSDAQPGRLNLAQPLADGQQLYLARRGHDRSEITDPVPAGSATTPAGGVGGAPADPTAGRPSVPSTAEAPTAGAAAAKVDLNQASESDLDGLPGIGPVTAGKIIAWRTAHGHFSSITELQEIDGIGPKTYAQLSGRVTV